MKKIISLVLVAVMLCSFASISVFAEDPAPAPTPTPELSFTKTIQVVIPDTHRLTNEDGSGFKVTLDIDDKHVIPMDGASTAHTFEIVSIEAQKDGFSRITYDPDYSDTTTPNPFFEYFKFPEGEPRKAVSLYVTINIDFTDKEVFGDLGYEISVTGFSAPPDIGGIGGIIGGAGDSLPIPTTVTDDGEIKEFPKVNPSTIVPLNSSTKKVYSDAEFPEVEGTKVQFTTVQNSYDAEGNLTGSTDLATGTVTYAPNNALAFTTLPARTERVPVGTTEIVTYFEGYRLSTIPVSVSHAYSSSPVCITTDKYTDNKPGYHAIVCNGCGDAHSASQHVVDPDSWVSNKDESFVADGTASTTCLVCGATLTKDIKGSADFNTAFANYHFLLVIFEYISVILRIINISVG